MKTCSFVSTYQSKDGYRHLYFYPGNDGQNHPLKQLYFSSLKNFHYRYTKMSDNAIDYIILDDFKKIAYQLINLEDRTAEQCIATFE